MAGFNTITKAFDGIMYIIVVLFGGLFLVEGKMSSGDIVAFILYVQTLLTTVRRIVEFTEQFQRGMTGIERFTEIMGQDIEIFDDEDAVDLEDVKLDDIVMDKYPIDKLGYTGGSYGGFMANWMMTHTNRFDCFVSQRSISNWISFSLISDIGFYIELENVVKSGKTITHKYLDYKKYV